MKGLIVFSLLATAVFAQCNPLQNPCSQSAAQDLPLVASSTPSPATTDNANPGLPATDKASSQSNAAQLGASITGQSNTTTPVTFTNTTQETPYLKSFLNEINPTDMIYGAGCCSAVDAIAGGVKIPDTAKTTNGGDAIAGYVQNYCPAARGSAACNGASFFGVAQNGISKSAVWGINTVVGSVNGVGSLAGTTEIGYEDDMNAGNDEPSRFIGITVLGDVGHDFVMPNFGYAYGVGVFAPGRNGGGNAPYPTAFLVAQGATSGQAMYVSPVCGAGAGACNSQYIEFAGQKSGGGYGQSSIGGDSRGNFYVNTLKAGMVLTSNNFTTGTLLTDNATGANTPLNTPHNASGGTIMTQGEWTCPVLAVTTSQAAWCTFTPSIPILVTRIEVQVQGQATCTTQPRFGALTNSAAAVALPNATPYEDSGSISVGFGANTHIRFGTVGSDDCVTQPTNVMMTVQYQEQ